MPCGIHRTAIQQELLKTFHLSLIQFENNHSQVSNIRCTLVVNQIVDHPDVVEASPVGTAPTTSSFSTYHLATIYYVETTANLHEKYLSFEIWYLLY